MPERPSDLDVLGRSPHLACDSSVDFALALDWYKVPEEDVDPRNWRNTELGDVVHRGKYWYREPSKSSLQRVIGHAVVARLCRLIGEHPRLSAMDGIVAVPGHDRSGFLRGKACQ